MRKIRMQKMTDKIEAILDKTLGVILAGGQSRRMEGKDKGLIKLGSATLIERAVKRLKLQIPDFIISTNSNSIAYKKLNTPITKDAIAGFAGPLAGVLTAMRWAQLNRPKSKQIITIAVDTPFFPKDYAMKMLETHDEATQITIANSKDRNHPVFAIWDISLADKLEVFLVDEGNKKVMMFAERYSNAIQTFDDKSGIDPFFNINTYDDLKEAQKHL